MDWVFSEVEAWNMEEKKPQFLFNFSVSFKEEKDGWFTTTFELSKELAKHSEVTLYCVSRSSSFAVNEHINLAVHIPDNDGKALHNKSNADDGK